jgi:hypothetical protein
VIPWRTKKLPTHLNNSSSQPRFLVLSLKASRTFFISQLTAKRGPVPSRQRRAIKRKSMRLALCSLFRFYPIVTHALLS